MKVMKLNEMFNDVSNPVISTQIADNIKKQFNDFLKTDWKSAWRNGTLPKYFGESKKRVLRKRSRMTERIFPDQYQSNVDGKVYTIKWHDGKGKYYVQIPCARKVLWSDSPEELMGMIDIELKKCYKGESCERLKEADYSETDEFTLIKEMSHWIKALKTFFVDDSKVQKAIADYFYYDDGAHQEDFKELQASTKALHKLWLKLDAIVDEVEEKEYQEKNKK